MNALDLNYEKLRSLGTGNRDDIRDSIVVDIPFDRYVIKVRISSTKEFLGIEEISVNKDFLSHSQKITLLSGTGYHNVEEYYKDEEE